MTLENVPVIPICTWCSNMPQHKISARYFQLCYPLVAKVCSVLVFQVGMYCCFTSQQWAWHMKEWFWMPLQRRDLINISLHRLCKEVSMDNTRTMATVDFSLWWYLFRNTTLWWWARNKASWTSPCVLTLAASYHLIHLNHNIGFPYIVLLYRKTICYQYFLASQLACLSTCWDKFTLPCCQQWIWCNLFTDFQDST